MKDEVIRMLTEALEAERTKVQRLEAELSAFKSGRGPDNPAECPAGHGDQCCGHHKICRAAIDTTPTNEQPPKS